MSKQRWSREHKRRAPVWARLKNGQVHISAGLFWAGLVLVIGKAGACDLGAGLCEVMPGVLAGMAMMAAGAYGLWLVDTKKGPAAERPQSHARENNSIKQVYPIFSEKSRRGRKA